METLLSLSLMMTDSLSEIPSTNRASSSSVQGLAMMKEGLSFSEGRSGLKIVERGGMVAVVSVSAVAAAAAAAAAADAAD